MQFFGIPVLGKFGPKNQNCQFNLKFGTKLKPNMHDSIYVILFWARNTLFGKIWSQNSKFLKMKSDTLS